MIQSLHSQLFRNMNCVIASLVLISFPLSMAVAQDQSGAIAVNPLRGNPGVAGASSPPQDLVSAVTFNQEISAANLPVLQQSAASNQPATTRRPGVEALVGQGIWNSTGEYQHPLEHSPTGPIRSLSESVTESQKPVPDSQVQQVSLTASESSGSPTIPFAGPASLELSATIRKIAFATAVAMFGCVVIVFVAKLLKGNRAATKQIAPVGSRHRNSAPRVEQSLSLGNKSLLRLVRVGHQQVLVATDATGIKSVLAIQPDFESMLDDKPVTEKTETDLQQMLASFLDKSK